MQVLLIAGSLQDFKLQNMTKMNKIGEVVVIFNEETIVQIEISWKTGQKCKHIIEYLIMWNLIIFLKSSYVKEHKKNDFLTNRVGSKALIKTRNIKFKKKQKIWKIQISQVSSIIFVNRSCHFFGINKYILSVKKLGL